MAVRQIRPVDRSIACDFCGRNMLRGEVGETLHLAGEKRTTCEMCRMRALKAGWRRDPVTDEPRERSSSGERGRLLGRLRGRLEQPGVPSAPRAPQRVRAEPTGAKGRARAAIEHFNGSPHRGTIASIGSSLGTPTVTLVDAGDEGFDVIAAWDLCWYRWRVELGQGGATVLETGRGFELSELEPGEVAGGVASSSDGTLTWLS